MKKNKMHIIDLIFIVGAEIISIVGELMDYFYWKDVEYGGFPVFSCESIYVSYALWLILFIYSSIKYKEEKDKPKFLKWFTFFIVPYLHMAFLIVNLLIVALLTTLFNL